MPVIRAVFGMAWLLRSFVDKTRTVTVPRADESAWSELAHARAVHVLRTAGVDALVLKGPAVAAWLYPEGRTSGDCDLLVAPSSLPAARQALTGHGYTDQYAGVHAGEVAEHSAVFADGAMGGRELDLHTTFPGLGAAPERVWAALWARRTPASLGHVPVHFPDPASTALVLVLHAARDGLAAPRGVEDVRRAVAALDENGWRDVAALARELDATAALAAGLRLLPDGAALADRLGLGGATDPEWALRSASGSTLALRLVQLRTASWPGRVRLLAREAFPSAAFLRQGWPVARRGPLGLAAAYVQRLASLVRRLPAAWREARGA
jgi:hypothetical protein